ncbi:hypothetical protein AVEN_220876-1 [Araneus ventricosus]|uniref:Uncharacterized protein n=1 Tax=Araneus ventricosus TaxID=182803 RepID=A0A4Y2D8S3_ARAVE|nr:hypothetical protein AVEN_220876-1 [Araneus ventricosus]
MTTGYKRTLLTPLTLAMPLVMVTKEVSRVQITGSQKLVCFNLVILTSPLEATRGLFWVGPRNFELWSDDEDVNLSLQLLSNGRIFEPTTDLTCTRFTFIVDLWWIEREILQFRRQTGGYQTLGNHHQGFLATRPPQPSLRS